MSEFTTAETARRMTKAARCLIANDEHMRFVLNEIEIRALKGEDFFILDKTYDNKPNITLSAGTINALKGLGYSVEYVPVMVGAFCDFNTKISW